MATRAPRGAARPHGGTAGRTSRAGGSSRARSGRQVSGNAAASPTRSRGSARSGASRGGAARGRAAYGRGRVRPARRPPRNPLIVLAGWLVAAVAGIWMELAGGVGYIARLFGGHARDLDEAHRRDGAGL